MGDGDQEDEVVDAHVFATSELLSRRYEWADWTGFGMDRMQHSVVGTAKKAKQATFFHVSES